MSRFAWPNIWKILLALIILGGAWWYYHINNHDAHVALAEKAKSEFDALGIPLNGVLIFTEKNSNKKCNSSEYIAVYSTEKPLIDLCESVVASLPEGEWNQIQRCRIIERRKEGNAPQFKYVKEDAIKKENINEYKDGFSASFYPKEASHPLFIAGGYDNDILEYAKKFGRGFYVLKYRYQGPYDYEKYPCTESDDCECAYYTYSHRTFSDGREYHWEQ